MIQHSCRAANVNGAMSLPRPAADPTNPGGHHGCKEENQGEVVQEAHDRQDSAEEGAKPVNLLAAAFGAFGLFVLAVFMGWL